jgi:hypothetical protein
VENCHEKAPSQATLIGFLKLPYALIMQFSLLVNSGIYTYPPETVYTVSGGYAKNPFFQKW